VKNPTSLRHTVWKSCKVIFWTVLLLLMCGGVWASVGIPGAWFSWVLNKQLPEGAYVEAREVDYIPGKGGQVYELKLFTARDRVTPLLTADEISLKPAWSQWIRHREWSGTFKIINGSFETNLGTWADDLITNQPLRLHGIQGELKVEPEKVTFENFRGSLSNMDLQVNGEMRIQAGGQDTPINRKARVVAKVVKFLENFEFDTPPLIDITLRPSSEDTGFPVVRVTLDHTGPARHRGLAIEAIKIDAVFENQLLTIKEFLVRENSERSLSGSAEVNFSKDEFVVRLENTLRRFGLEAVSPFALGEVLDRLQLRLEDRCDFTMQVGPSSFKHPGNKIGGTFQVENGFYRDGFFPQLSFTLDWDSPRLALENVDGILGQTKGKGPIRGDVAIDFDSGFWEVDFKGSFYPDLAISMVGAVTEKYLREWEFRGDTPQLEGYYYQEKTGAPMILRIDAKGEDVLWRGTSFDRISAQVTYENEILSILDAKAGRGTELFTGELIFDPRLQGCTFSFESSFHLPDILQLIGPQISRRLQLFRFRGSSEIDALGFIDFSPKMAHDFKGTFAFEDLVIQWLSLNHLTGSVRVNDQVLEVPDLQASLEGGSLNANFRSEKTFSDDGRFALAMKLKNMDLYKVITKATDLEDTPYRGNLSLDLNLAGKIRDTPQAPRSDSYVGEGHVEIRDGSLFRIPLLFGLSQLLNKLVKGFGYASQSDFTADFKIGDGKISSKELFLQGNVLSIAGPGSYTFDGRKISADLKIHLFKDGIISDALKLILWPIRKLIEVQLTGTLDHPDWQPKNLPKELFGK